MVFKEDSVFINIFQIRQNDSFSCERENSHQIVSNLPKPGWKLYRLTRIGVQKDNASDCDKSASSDSLILARTISFP